MLKPTPGRAGTSPTPGPPTLPNFAPIDLIPDPVIGIDAHRRINLWNRAAETTYGFTRAEALGQRAPELFGSRFPIPLPEIFETVADTGHWQGDVVKRTKDGRELTVESRWIALFDEQGNVSGGLGIDRDITARLEDQSARERGEASAERERLHGRLSRAQRLESIGQLAGGIAHDFNNLLSVIINYAAMIAGELEGMQRASADSHWTSMRDDLGEVQLAAERAARLTHQLLAFSRQDVGNPVSIDLNDSVRGIEELLRRTIGAEVRLVVSLAEALRPIGADPAQLDQALLNLAINSRDAMPDGGTLTIDTANVEVDDDYAGLGPQLAPGSYVRLRVSDAGSGMAADVVEHAFDPFFTTKPMGQGTGLGLATVYWIVRQAGGRVQLYSEPGIGTTFIALFPAAAAVTDAQAPRVTNSMLTGTETILLVQDQDALRDVTHRILTRAGYQVIVASNAPAALQAVSAHSGSIDLCLSDVVMPLVPGPELALRLRETHPQLPVLYVSGFAEPVLRESMHLGRVDLVEKPFTAPELLSRVRRTLAASWDGHARTARRR